MFQDLDDTLQRLLSDPGMPPAFTDLVNADVSFETPDRTYAPTTPTVNLFLYDVQENRVLRDTTLGTRVDATNGFRLRRPPVRLDCAYLATTWSNRTLAARAAEEHALLGLALRWLSRFATIPPVYLQGGLVDQAFPIPIGTAQTDPNRDAGDFWTAMGIAPRAAFYVMTTLAMDLDVDFETPLVTTTIARYSRAGGPGGAQELININGYVFDPAGDPVVDADVSLAPDGTAVRTDGSGRYSFFRLRRGVPYVVTAGKAGVGRAVRNVQVPSPSGEYDVQLA